MTERIFLLGGARSGKSRYAEGLFGADEPVTYLATARRDPTDQEWTDRITEHVARRPPAWRTVEITTPDQLPAQLTAMTTPMLVDDVVNWLAGAMDDAGCWQGDPDTLAVARRHGDALVDTVRACQGPLALVSNEVGLGVVPATRSGRLFRDELGSLNARLADACDRVLFLVAGIPMELKAPRR